MTDISQVTIIGEPQPKTWDDYERGCLATFAGWIHTPETAEAFRHGMQTVFNLLRNEFPPAELCKRAERMEAALRLFADDANWFENHNDYEHKTLAAELVWDGDGDRDARQIAREALGE